MRRRWGRTFPFAKKWTAPKPIPRRWGSPRWLPKAPSPSGGKAPKEWPLRKKKRLLRRKHALLLLFALLAILIVQTIVFFDKKLREPLMFLAQVRVKQMATEAINAAITQELASTADAGKMIQWKTDQSGKVLGFLIDFKEQMRLTSRTVQIVDRVLKEKEAVPDHIPIGHALESPLISAIGPKVAVTFHPVSAVKAEVGTRQTETGINMVLIEVFIRIRTEIAVVIPFDKAPDVLETEIPLSYALVVGNVPMYYYDGKGNPVGSTAQHAPPIVLPAPEKQEQEH